MWWTLFHSDGTQTHVTSDNFDVAGLRGDWKNGHAGDIVRFVRGRVWQTQTGAIVE